MKNSIGYLGPEGTYSHIAAQRLGGGANLKAYPTFFSLFKALESGEADGIVLPIENSLNGAVTQNLDLLQEFDGVYAEKWCVVKIEHRFMVKAGADPSKITDIYSHKQALEQCSKFLALNYPDAILHETSSTAGGMCKLTSDTDACIVGAHCDRAGYTLSPRNVSDIEDNFTQFLLVKRGKPDEKAVSDRIFFSVTCRHEAGALVGILSVLKDGGINMTEIESRPIKGRAGEFRFFIEAEGDYSKTEVKRVLSALAAAARSFRLLGCYLTDKA